MKKTILLLLTSLTLGMTACGELTDIEKCEKARDNGTFVNVTYTNRSNVKVTEKLKPIVILDDNDGSTKITFADENNTARILNTNIIEKVEE